MSWTPRPQEYRAGRLLTGELKKVCIEKLQAVVGAFQAEKAKVTEEILEAYMDGKRRIDPSIGVAHR
jgi:tryptophanyl-tRNA synthetase